MPNMRPRIPDDSTV